jgi:hypothetical protein
MHGLLAISSLTNYVNIYPGFVVCAASLSLANVLANSGRLALSRPCGESNGGQ